MTVVLTTTYAAEPATQEGFEASWESLLDREPAEWLLDAKFGIYTHWGVYSVPAHETEWYPKRMYDTGKRGFAEHHTQKWGDPREFNYHKFVDMFKAEEWDPALWAKLMKDTGARYAGMAVVHHDGFLLWDSKVNRWNAANMGPKRDCFGDYCKALRAEGLKTIATFHHIRTFNWYLPGVGGLGGDINRDLAQSIRDKGWALTDPKYNDLYWNELAGGKYEDFLAEWQAKVLEVMDNYRPDVVWFDGGLFRDDPEAEKISLNLLAHYHNQAQEWGKQVEVLNKLPTRGIFNFPRDYGILTFEEGRDRLPWVDRPWIDDMKISYKGWCHVDGQTYKTANEVIDGLCDRVARGGGLLFNFSPHADGTVPEEQLNTMLEIGQWLKTNGEAIYATRPWKVVGQGDETELRKRQWLFIDCDATDIRFTRSKDLTKLYAILLGYPKSGTVSIDTLSNQTAIADGGIKRVSLLGHDQPLEWERTGIDFTLQLPAGISQEEPAYVLKIEVNGKLSE